MKVEGKPSSEVINILLGVAWTDYNSISSDKRDVEFKASIILAGVGVLFGLEINFLEKLNSWLVFSCLGLLILSGILCVFSIALRDYHTLTLMKTYECFKDNNILNIEDSAKESLYWSLSTFTKNNRDIYNKSVKFLEMGVFFFLAGIFTLFLSALINPGVNYVHLLIISGL
jgi:hypothetical protein